MQSNNKTMIEWLFRAYNLNLIISRVFIFLQKPKLGFHVIPLRRRENLNGKEVNRKYKSTRYADLG